MVFGGYTQSCIMRKKVLNWIIEIYRVFVNMHGFYCFAAQLLHTVSNFPKWIIIDTNLSAVITHWEAVQIDSPITRIAKENGCTSIVQSGLALKMAGGLYIKLTTNTFPYSAIAFIISVIAVKKKKTVAFISKRKFLHANWILASFGIIFSGKPFKLQS